MNNRTPSDTSFRWRRPLLRLLSYSRRIWRRIENFVFGIALTLVCLYFVLQLPVVQNWIIGKITGYLSEELQTRVEIRHVDISLFDNLVLEGFYVEDLNGDTLLYAGKLTAGLNSNIFTLFRNKLEFNEISLDKARFNIRRAEGEAHNNLWFILDYFDTGPSTRKKQPAPFRIRIQNLRLTDVEFLQDDRERGQKMFFRIPSGVARINNLDIPSKIADVQSVNLEGLYVKIEEYESKPLPGPKKVSNTTAAPDSTRKKREPFRFKIARFSLDNGRFSLDRYQASPTRHAMPAVMDYEHMAVQDIQFQADDVSFDDDLVFRGVLKHMAARENCGFVLSHGEAREVVVCDTLAALYGVKIETPGSSLGDTIAFHYNTYRDFNRFVSKVRMEGHFAEGSVLRLGDIMYFSPNLEENTFFIKNRDLQAQVAGVVEGKVNRIKGRNLHLQLGQDTYMRGNFSGDGLNDGQDQIVLDFDFEPLQTNMRTISEIIPGFSAPPQFGKLGNIRFTGKYQLIFGYNHVLYGDFNSDLGYGNMDMSLDLTKGLSKATYAGVLNMKSFNLASWTGDKNFGKSTFHVRITNGSGLTLPTVNTTLSGVIDTFYYKGYNYRNIGMNGTFEQFVFNGKLGIQDPNIDFSFDGSVNFRDSIPVYMFSANLNLLDMKALNLTNKDWVLSGQVERIRMRAKTLDDLAGQVTFRKMRLVENQETVYRLDSLHLASLFRPNGDRYMLLRSDAADAYIEGRFNFASAPYNFLVLLSRHYPQLSRQIGLPPGDSSLVLNDSYEINVRIKNTRNLTRLFAPGLDTLQNITADGEVRAARGLVKLAVKAPWIRYQGTQVNNLMFNWDSRDSEANYALLAPGTILPNKQKLDTISLKGTVRPNALQFNLVSRNATELLNNVNLNGTLSTTEDSLWQIQFDPSNLTLFNDVWAMEENNFIRFGPDRIITRNFQLFNNLDQRVLLDSENEGRGLLFSLTNFDLSEVNRFFAPDGLTYRAKLFDFEVHVKDVFNLQGFELFVTSDTLFLNDAPFGEITGNFEMADLNSPLLGKIFLQGKKHQLRVAGGWLPETGAATQVEELDLLKPGEMQLRVSALRFPANILERFIPSISKTAGSFSAEVALGGPPSRLGMKGYADIHEAQFQIDYLKSLYHIHQQRVTLSSSKIWADTVTIWDASDKNKAYVVGGLRHNYFRDWKLDCKIETEGNNFMVLNTYREDNDLYYGQGIGNFKAKFSGSFAKTNIEIDAITGPQTRLYIPLSSTADAEEITFIKFKDKNTSDSTAEADDGTFRIKDLKGLNFEMNITVTDDAEVQLIFDEQAGDIIKGRGEGDITLTINREGEFKMYGGYTIRQGDYLFTLLNLVNKPFTVANGGTVHWSGDPYQAQINLDATYDENTSVYNFISSELALISDQNLLRDATKATRVLVTMHLKGSLLQPNITFDLDFPNVTGQTKTLVDNKLRQMQQDQNELNRQVFGLVVVGSFLPSNAGNTQTLIQTSAFNTLTQVLSNQFSSYLTGLAAEWFGGAVSSIDLDVAYNEYQNSLNDPNLGQIGRELQVRLTSGFANDRITVQFGSQFGLSRPGTTVQNGFLGEDVTVEIQLTENRQWRAKIYQRTEPDIAIGQLRSRYGFGLSFRKDYDSFDDMMSGIGKWFKKNR